MSQSLEHDATHGHIDHCLARLAQPLVLLREPSALTQPRARPVRWKLGVDVYRRRTQRRPGVEYVPVTPNSGRRNKPATEARSSLPRVLVELRAGDCHKLRMLLYPCGHGLASSASRPSAAEHEVFDLSSFGELRQSRRGQDGIAP